MPRLHLKPLFGAAKTLDVVFALLAGCGCATTTDRLINRTVMPPPYEVDAESANFHRTLFIADLHADTLLWDRDLLERSSRGHVDLPRLREGNVSLQVFSAVTRVPLFLRLDNNGDKPDFIRTLARSQDWPRKSRSTLIGRTLFQAHELRNGIERSNGALTLILGPGDLEELLAARSRGDPVIGAMLSLEGAHALEGDLANLDRLHESGYRVIGLNHFIDNEFSGSAHGKGKGGLTAKGRALVIGAQERGMIIDLAHASPRAIEDTLEIASRPLIVSHGGVCGTCDSVRNLSDAQVRAAAASGGVIGIGLFRYATCGKTIADTVRAMRYAADLVGVGHVALGSDWDGSAAAIDASGLPLLTEGLLKAGFTREDIAAIMGGNVLRFLRETLH